LLPFPFSPTISGGCSARRALIPPSLLDKGNRTRTICLPRGFGSFFPSPLVAGTSRPDLSPISCCLSLLRGKSGHSAAAPISPAPVVMAFFSIPFVFKLPTISAAGPSVVQSGAVSRQPSRPGAPRHFCFFARLGVLFVSLIAPPFQLWSPLHLAVPIGLLTLPVLPKARVIYFYWAEHFGLISARDLRLLGQFFFSEIFATLDFGVALLALFCVWAFSLFLPPLCYSLPWHPGRGEHGHATILPFFSRFPPHLSVEGPVAR